LSGLGTASIQALTASQITWLKTDQIQTLTSVQIKALTATNEAIEGHAALLETRLNKAYEGAEADAKTFLLAIGGDVKATVDKLASVGDEVPPKLEKAVTAATREWGCTVVDFSASSEVGIADSSKGRYVFFVEFERAPKDGAAFIDAVDRSLCAQNRVYREHRAGDVAILAPELCVLGRGGTRRFMDALLQSSVQNKFPHIVDESRSKVLRTMAAEAATRGNQ
jgi:hypothetical protein